MTYKHFIECYPYFDLFFELFKGIIPTLVALLAIFLNNSLSKKRELIYRKKCLQLDYFQKILSWLHEVKNNAMEVSLSLDKALCKANPEERNIQCKNFMMSVNNMNRNFVTWHGTYAVVIESYDCEVKWGQLKKVLLDFTEELVKIKGRYIHQPDTSGATIEINIFLEKAFKAIDESILLLLKDMKELY